MIQVTGNFQRLNIFKKKVSHSINQIFNETSRWKFPGVKFIKNEGIAFIHQNIHQTSHRKFPATKYT